MMNTRVTKPDFAWHHLRDFLNHKISGPTPKHPLIENLCRQVQGDYMPKMLPKQF